MKIRFLGVGRTPFWQSWTAGICVTLNGVVSMSEIPGVYHYHRIGHDVREMELCPDGRIGLGAGRAEQRWALRRAARQRQLSIFGDFGEICRLTLEPDGCWRG